MLNLLTDVLGPGDVKSKGNHAFYCPFCRHRKKKLEIHPELGAWACWTCHSSGKSIKSLLVKLNVSDAIMQRYNKIAPARKIWKDSTEIKASVNLPKQFKPLYIKSNSPYWKRAYKYITEDRKLTNFDLFKYNIGYSDDGKYSGMLIFPNYDKEAKLNFLTTRSYLGEKRFVNEKINRNIVGYEMQLNPSLPLILTEGAIDAITMRINSSPLYGSTMSNALKTYILDNDVEDVYLCLDPDAIKFQIDYLKYLMALGVKSYHIKIPSGEDVNSLGHDRVWEMISRSKPISDSELFDLEIKMKL